MKITCNDCQAEIEIDPPTLAALEGQENFVCPACEELVAVPVSSTPVKVTAAAAIRPAGAVAKQSASTLASGHNGLNRNLLILGGVTLLVLGGLGFFLASQKSGDTNITTQNIRKEILNNTYFTQLIASGVTTSEELEKIGEIRPYGDGFIGISKDALSSEQAQQAAKRMGAQILAVDQVADTSGQQMIAWLRENLVSETSSTAWVIQNQALGILVGEEILAAKGSESERKALFHWHGSAADQKNLQDLSISSPWWI